MSTYTQKQAADAMLSASQNEGASGSRVGMMLGGQLGGMVGTQVQHAPAMPPPLPAQPRYHVAVNGQQQGPFGLGVLQGMVSSGQLTRETLVWCDGMPGWSAAGTVPALSSLFGSVPPPIPPSMP